MVDISLDSDTTTVSRKADRYGAEAKVNAANPVLANTWYFKSRNRDLMQSQRSMLETQRQFSDIITPEEKHRPVNGNHSPSGMATPSVNYSFTG